jgi:tetratricopeptide (TPR) repeat protein
MWATTVAVVGSAAIVALLTGLPAAGVTQPWIVIGSGALAAMLTVIVGLWQDRLKRTNQWREESDRATRSACLTDSDGHLPKVRHMTTGVLLGVHPAGPGSDALPPYIRRDVDEELRHRISTSGFILLVGDSTAGKTRALFEAMVASVPEHLLVVPTNQSCVGIAVEAAAQVPHSVLWLDDIERYLGSEGLTRNRLATLLSGERNHHLILGTLRSAEEMRFIDRAPSDSALPIFREARDVLEQASRISVPRLFTEAELQRAEERRADRRIAEALLHADQYGVAEYMACGPELLQIWTDAWSPNTEPHAPTHPRAASLIQAAIDLRRCGFRSPAPRKLVEELHEYYLEQRGGSRLAPEPIDSAWGWATQPRRASTALLHPVADDRVEAFDYLVDAVKDESGPDSQVPSELVWIAISSADYPDAETIAATASGWGRHQIAAAAWRRSVELRKRASGPHDLGTLIARNGIVRSLWEGGASIEALAEGHSLLHDCIQSLGVGHRLTIESRYDLGAAMWRHGDFSLAINELRATLVAAERVIELDDVVVLNIRNVIAVILWETGRLAEAEREHTSVIEAQTRVLGPEHHLTLTSRNNMVTVLRGLKRFDEAEAEARAVIADRTRLLGNFHPETLVTRNNLSVVLREMGRLADAETESRSVLAQWDKVDPFHIDALTAKSNLGATLGIAGRYDEAKRLLAQVISDLEQTSRSDHPYLFRTHRQLGEIMELEGDLQSAEQEYRAALSGRKRAFRPDSPLVRQSVTDVDRILLAQRRQG